MFGMLAIVVASIVVPAGSSQQLASVLSGQMKTPVVVMIDPARPKWSAATIERDRLTEKDVDRLLKSKLNTAAFPQGTYGLAPPAWPEFFRSLANRRLYERNAVTVCGKGHLEWSESAKGVKAKTVEGAVSVEEVLAKFDPLVSYHRFFKGTRIVLDAPLGDPTTFIKTIAAAVGASVTKTARGTYLDIDIPAFRARSIADLQRMAQIQQPVIRAEAEFNLVAMEKVPDAILRQALSEEASNGPLHWRSAPADVRMEANRKVWTTTTTIKGKKAGESQLAEYNKSYELDNPVILVGVGGFAVAYESRIQRGAFLNFR